MKDPAVLFYFQDFLVGTEFMSDDEVGKYIRILCHQADKGALSLSQLKRICRDSEVPEVIMEKLKTDENGNYYQSRMRVEREKRISYSESRRKNREPKHMNNICRTYDKHMENENINRDYNFLFNKIINENKIELTEEFKSLFLEWLKYKSEKRQTYKETGLKNFIMKSLESCNGDVETLREMILYSTSNNYDGLFKEKSYGKTGKNSGASVDQLAEHFARKHGLDSPGRQS